MFLFNTDLEINQRVFILADIVSNLRTNKDRKPASKNELLEEVKYEFIASVIQQCEQNNQRGSIQSRRDSLNANQANGAEKIHSRSQGNNRNRSPEQIA